MIWAAVVEDCNTAAKCLSAGSTGCSLIAPPGKHLDRKENTSCIAMMSQRAKVVNKTQRGTDRLGVHSLHARTLTLATSEQLSTLEPTRELYMVISELREKRMMKKGARGVHTKCSSSAACRGVVGVQAVWCAAEVFARGPTNRFLGGRTYIHGTPCRIRRTPLRTLSHKMSETTAEERTGLSLAACFNDKRRHHRLIGHQARTFDFQVTPIRHSSRILH